MSTLEALQEILIEEFSLTRVQLTPDAELTGLGIDSLEVIDLMFKIEDRFGLQIKDDVPTTLVTLNDVVLYVDGLLLRQPLAVESTIAHLSPKK
jgi:acyl carrier protein